MTTLFGGSRFLLALLIICLFASFADAGIFRKRRGCYNYGCATTQGIQVRQASAYSYNSGVIISQSGCTTGTCQNGNCRLQR